METWLRKKIQQISWFYFFLSLLTLFFVNFFIIQMKFNPTRSQGLLIDKSMDFLTFFENKLLDSKFKLQKNRAGSEKIVIVAIDEESLDVLGRWQSWPRKNYAHALLALAHHGSKVVGFDIVFDSPEMGVGHDYLQKLKKRYSVYHPEDPQKDFVDLMNEGLQFSLTDWMLVEAVKKYHEDRGKSVVLGYFSKALAGKKQILQKKEEMPAEFKSIWRSAIPAIVGESFQFPAEINRSVHEYAFNFPKLQGASPHAAYFSMGPDSDGVVRHYQLVSRMYETFYPSLAMKMMEQYLGTGAVIKKDQEGALYVDFLGKNTLIPIDDSGQIKINFIGRQNSFITISLSDLLNEDEWISYNHKGSYGKPFKKLKRELLKDKIVLFGATATGIYDLRNTPKQVNLPGVEIHATILHQFLEKSFLITRSNKVLLVNFLLSTLGIFLFIVWLKLTGPLLGVIGAFVFSMAIFGIDYFWLFKNFELIHGVPLYLGIWVPFIIVNGYKYFVENKEKRQIRRTFSHYVAEDVVEKMIEDPGAIKLGGETKELTVLFTDIKDFTSISERLPPEKLTKFLSEFLQSMSDIIFKWQGTLDKFIGDAIMCFWGAPVENPQHQKMACMAAIEMQEKLKSLREQFYNEYSEEIYMRVGVSTGEMAVGNMGSKTHFAYTVIGDAVNLASRLEGLNKIYETDIIVSENLYHELGGEFHFRLLDQVAVKGKTKPVKIYHLAAFKSTVDPLFTDIKETYEKALDHYFRGEFSASLDLLKSDILKDDGPSQEMKKRCEELGKRVSRGLLSRKEWEGVWVYEEK